MRYFFARDDTDALRVGNDNHLRESRARLTVLGAAIAADTWDSPLGLYQLDAWTSVEEEIMCWKYGPFPRDCEVRWDICLVENREKCFTHGHRYSSEAFEYCGREYYHPDEGQVLFPVVKYMATTTAYTARRLESREGIPL